MICEVFKTRLDETSNNQVWSHTWPYLEGQPEISLKSFLVWITQWSLQHTLFYSLSIKCTALFTAYSVNVYCMKKVTTSHYCHSTIYTVHFSYKSSKSPVNKHSLHNFPLPIWVDQSSLTQHLLSVRSASKQLVTFYLLLPSGIKGSYAAHISRMINTFPHQQQSNSTQFNWTKDYIP